MIRIRMKIMPRAEEKPPLGKISHFTSKRKEYANNLNKKKKIQSYKIKKKEDKKTIKKSLKQ